MELKSQFSRKLSLFLVVCLVFLLSFILVTFLRPNFHTLDIQVNLWTPIIQSPLLTLFADGIAIVFDTTSLVLFSLVLAGLLFLVRRKPFGLLLFGAMGGDALLVTVIKTIEHIARPTNGILADNGFSYPSGHSAGVVVFVGLLVFFAWRRWQSPLPRFLVAIGMGTLVGIVGFDRVYLNVHWLSDVFGGWLFGAFWLMIAVSVFVWLENTGKFRSRGFNSLAKGLYVVSVFISILVVLSGLIT